MKRKDWFKWKYQIYNYKFITKKCVTNVVSKKGGKGEGGLRLLKLFSSHLTPTAQTSNWCTDNNNEKTPTKDPFINSTGSISRWRKVSVTLNLCSIDFWSVGTKFHIHSLGMDHDHSINAMYCRSAGGNGASWGWW